MKRKIITISLIASFSVLLWVFVSFSGEFSITLNLPTQVIDVPENHSVSSVSANDVSISLKGQGWQLAQYTLGRDPKFFIPSPTKVGEKEIPTRNVLHANSWLSTSLQLAEITPGKIKVHLEQTISKKVKVMPVIALSYKPGYGLVSPITIEPDSVLVTGPKSLVDEVNIINTEGRGLTNLEDRSSVIFGIKPLKYIKIDATECKVNFDVQKIVDKTFEELVIGTKSIPSRYELILSPTKLNVVLRGGISQLSKLKNDDLNVYVKFEQAINDTNGAIEPTIEIPEFTSIIDIKPKRLEYIIKKY
jgi:YbbR domain-containing protein